MRKRFLLILAAFWLGGALHPLSGVENITVKEDVFVAKDEVQDNIISFGGNVTVEGVVKESIVVFGGTITLGGEVGDSVVGIGSEVRLRPTAVIKGDVISLGGVLNKELGCTIKGDTVYFKAGELFSKIFKGGLFSVSLLPIILILKLISFFIWLLVAIVVALVFPRQLALSSFQVRTSFWPIVGTGLLALVLFTTFVIFAALLSLVLIGIPFLLFLIAVGLIIKIFGEVVLFYFFGESIGKAFGNRTPAPLVAVILGLVAISFIKFIPFLGFLFSFCLSIVAWGAVIRTKFGTTENWFRRKPS